MPLAEATMLEINDIIERSSFSNLDRQKWQGKSTVALQLLPRLALESNGALHVQEDARRFLET